MNVLVRTLQYIKKRLPWKHEKNRPQKLLLISPNIFKYVMPIGTNPAQISISVPWKDTNGRLFTMAEVH